MVKEWIDQWNPFNSAKVLIWSEQLKALSEGKILPPVTVDTDPTTLCNYNCGWCNAQAYRKVKHMLSKEQLNKLVSIYSEWNVKSTCIAGGGEPTLNKHLSDFIFDLYSNGIESGVITNGSVVTEKQLEYMALYSRWVGFSIDAGNEETYIKIKGISDKNNFRKVLSNIEKLCNLRQKSSGNKVDVAFKYLVSPDNIHTIYKAADIAKKCGVQHFHMRPACVDNLVSDVKHSKYSFTRYAELIHSEINKSLGLVDENFQVFAVQHKFTPQLERKISFRECRATPLLATFGADGYCHLCFDLRGKEDFIMCRHEEILEYWGSEKHKRLIGSIIPQSCPRCTFGSYNEIIEKVFIKDRMCRNFP